MHVGVRAIEWGYDNTVHILIRYGLTGFVFLLFALHVSGWLRFGLLEKIENFTYDARVRLAMVGEPDPRIVIVDVDERSLAAEGQWRWSRDKLARLVDLLFDEYRIGVLGFDMVFAEPDATSGRRHLDALRAAGIGNTPAGAAVLAELAASLDTDAQFARSLAGRRVVMGYVLKGAGHDQTTVGALPAPALDERTAAQLPAEYLEAQAYSANLPMLQDAALSGGFFDNPTLDVDGVFRRVPLLRKFQGAVYGSLALEVLRLAVGNPDLELEYDTRGAGRSSLNLEAVRVGQFRAPVDENLAVLVPFRGPMGSFRYVSATDVLNQRVPADSLRNAIVLFGTSAPGLFDLRTTPVGAAYPGVEIHANIVSGILDGSIKHLAPYVKGIEAALLFAIGALLTWAFPRVRPLWGTVLVIGVLLFSGALGLLLWTLGDFVIPIGSPMVFTLIVILIQMTYGYFIESRDKREISRIFGQYVPPEIVDEMAEAPEHASMETDSREMTVLFSDVRNFTSISENLQPSELTELMNQFLTPLTGVIHRHRGTIDKYMGDAIMAFWGAPLRAPDHARRALEAALEMVRCMGRLGDEFEARGWPRLRIGVGLSTGQMSVGNMGSEFRRAYTALGDAVNLGARLESLTKEYGVDIICSDATRRAVDDFVFRDLDRVRVKGKNEPVGIFEPLGPRDGLDPAVKEELARYRNGLRAYRSQAWDQAETEFFGLQQSGAQRRIYEIYMARIAHFRRHPPGADWDGVFTHLSK